MFTLPLFLVITINTDSLVNGSSTVNRNKYSTQVTTTEVVVTAKKAA